MTEQPEYVKAVVKEQGSRTKSSWPIPLLDDRDMWVCKSKELNTKPEQLEKPLNAAYSPRNQLPVLNQPATRSGPSASIIMSNGLPPMNLSTMNLTTEEAQIDEAIKQFRSGKLPTPEQEYVVAGHFQLPGSNANKVFQESSIWVVILLGAILLYRSLSQLLRPRKKGSLSSKLQNEAAPFEEGWQRANLLANRAIRKSVIDLEFEAISQFADGKLSRKDCEFELIESFKVPPAIVDMVPHWAYTGIPVTKKMKQSFQKAWDSHGLALTRPGQPLLPFPPPPPPLRQSWPNPLAFDRSTRFVVGRLPNCSLYAYSCLPRKLAFHCCIRPDHFWRGASLVAPHQGS
jgi:hypothetical protein